TTTQFAESSSATPYASQNAAVSASDGSISATPTAPAGPSHAWSAAATGAASRSGRDSAGETRSVPRVQDGVVTAPDVTARAPTAAPSRGPGSAAAAVAAPRPRPAAPARRPARPAPGTG